MSKYVTREEFEAVRQWVRALRKGDFSATNRIDLGDGSGSPRVYYHSRPPDPAHVAPYTGVGDGTQELELARTYDATAIAGGVVPVGSYGPHAYCLAVSAAGLAGFTPGTTWTPATVPFLISGRMKTARTIAWKWTSTGAAVNAEWRVQDIGAAATVISGSRASTFTGQRELVTITFPAIADGVAEWEFQVRYAAASAGTITLESSVTIEGDL